MKYDDLPPELRAKLTAVDEIEAAFAACEHKYTAEIAQDRQTGRPFRWCNVCGAIQYRADGSWVSPHWRDVLVLGWVKANG